MGALLAACGNSEHLKAQTAPASNAPGATSACRPADDALWAPTSSHLADSPWPTFHQGSYAQASSPLCGPVPGDDLQATYIDTTVEDEGASPWSNFSAPYPDGSRTVWGANLTHVFKAVVKGDTFELADQFRFPGEFTGLLTNLHWNFLILEGNQVIVVDPADRRLYEFSDSDPNDPYSPIQLEGEYFIPAETTGGVFELNVTFDGYLIFQTANGFLGALTLEDVDGDGDIDMGELVETYKIPTATGEFVAHNQFSLDEDGGMYFVSTSSMKRINFTANPAPGQPHFSLGWLADYDTTGDQPTGELGSGTTPTLMGFGDMDKLVLITDAHTPNNMVAFWRDEIPDDWEGLPGLDRRVAAVTPLPFASPDRGVFSAENSPTAWGYDIAVAQWNGLFPTCVTAKGVQKLRWDPQRRALDVVWATDAVNFNGVPSYSAGSNLVYGSGRELDCNYYYYALDWDTGELAFRIRLGVTEDWDDQGNNNSINDDGSIVVGTYTGMMRIRNTRNDGP